jgi:hypothetical protein
VLRHWHWLRLRRRTVLAERAGNPRPNDAAVTGGPLYLLGLRTGNQEQAGAGLRMLMSAADQGIGVSGMNREGSSHRQLQLASLYRDAWLAARQQGRPEQWRLAAIARSLQAALKAITLPGGLPAIGATPAGFQPLPIAAPTDAADALAATELLRQASLFDLEQLRQDGWLRLDSGPWSGLWHCPPSGWPPVDGLAHQDLGAAELHWRGLPLFVDPGSPPPDDASRSVLFQSHEMHGGIALDAQDPYPLDHPFYSDPFRIGTAGPPPVLRTTADGVCLITDGYARFGGHQQIERHWRFDGPALVIDDQVLGTGRPRIERRLVTPWHVTPAENGVLLEQGDHHLHLSGDVAPSLHPARRWRADGQEEALTVILFALKTNIPWHGQLRLQPTTP